MARLGGMALGGNSLGSNALGNRKLGNMKLFPTYNIDRIAEIQAYHANERTKKHVDQVRLIDVYWAKERYGISDDEIEDIDYDYFTGYSIDELRLHKYDYYSKDQRTSITELKDKYRTIYFADSKPEWVDFKDSTNEWLARKNTEPEYDYYDLQDYYEYYPKNRGYLGAKLRRVSNSLGVDYQVGPSNYLYSYDPTFQSLISTIALNWRDKEFKDAFNSLSDGQIMNVYTTAKTKHEDVYTLLLESVLSSDEGELFSCNREQFHNRVTDVYYSLRKEQEVVKYSDIKRNIG